MGEISTELKSFKSSVDGRINGMNSCCDDIISKVSKLSSTGNSIKSTVSSLYDSQNKVVVLSTFDSLKSAYSTIESSVSGTLKGYVSSAQALLTQISGLEDINTQINDLRTNPIKYIVFLHLLMILLNQIYILLNFPISSH